jgi:hypothetical protein
MTDQTATAEPINTVVYMGDYLLKLRDKALDERSRLVAIVEDLSNNAKDKFVGPVRAKVAVAEAKVDKLTKHIKFINHGGIDQRPANEFTIPEPFKLVIPNPPVVPMGPTD